MGLKTHLFWKNTQAAARKTRVVARDEEDPPKINYGFWISEAIFWFGRACKHCCRVHWSILCGYYVRSNLSSRNTGGAEGHVWENISRYHNICATESKQDQHFINLCNSEEFHRSKSFQCGRKYVLLITASVNNNRGESSDLFLLPPGHARWRHPGAARERLRGGYCQSKNSAALDLAISQRENKPWQWAEAGGTRRNEKLLAIRTMIEDKSHLSQIKIA
jgi:hypothetical protein